jgi:hypothetical protein
MLFVLSKNACGCQSKEDWLVAAQCESRNFISAQPVLHNELQYRRDVETVKKWKHSEPRSG